MSGYKKYTIERCQIIEIEILATSKENALKSALEKEGKVTKEIYTTIKGE